MLPLSKVLQIQELLNQGSLSRRKIAKQLGVSRGVVNALASGQRGIYGREKTAEGTPDEPERCPSCGEMVYMPCVACMAWAYKKRLVRETRRAA